MLQAYDATTLAPVNVGDSLKTFRDEDGTLTRADGATVDGRAGKVTVTLTDSGEKCYWYASVVGLYVVDTESQAFCEASDSHEWHPVSGGREACRSCGTRRAVA